MQSKKTLENFPYVEEEHTFLQKRNEKYCLKETA